jgi:hypothetical protein
MNYEQVSNAARKEALELYKAVPEVMRALSRAHERCWKGRRTVS